MKIRYFADDGTEFATEEACVAYENVISRPRCWDECGNLMTRQQEWDGAYFCEIPRNTKLFLGGMLPDTKGRYICWDDEWMLYEDFLKMCPFGQKEE